MPCAASHMAQLLNQARCDLASLSLSHPACGNSSRSTMSHSAASKAPNGQVSTDVCLCEQNVLTKSYFDSGRQPVQLHHRKARPPLVALRVQVCTRAVAPRTTSAFVAALSLPKARARPARTITAPRTSRTVRTPRSRRFRRRQPEAIMKGNLTPATT